MESELDEACELLLGFTEYRTPTTKAVDFNATIGGNIDLAARELLTVATQQRETLTDGMDNSGHRVDPRNVVAAVENYLPSVYKITYSLEQNASTQIKLNRPLSFSWSTVLAKKRKEYKFGVLVFEVCFILTIQALGHYNVARELLDPERDNRASMLMAAAKELRKGAGILQFVAQVMLPRWVNAPDVRPPEVMSSVVGFVCDLFMSMAQRIIIVQAILKGSPPSAIAKLLLGLSEKCGNVSSSLAAMGPVKDTLVDSMVEEPALYALVGHGLALRYLGEAAKLKEKPGEAVAWLSASAETLGRVAFSPSMEGTIKPKVHAVRRVVDARLQELKADNEAIYFEGVPTRDRLDVPHGSFIATTAEFSLPEVEAVDFASKDVPAAAPEPAKAKAASPAKRASGAFGGWFGGKKKDASASKDAGAGAGGAMEAPPGYDREVFDSLPDDIKEEVVAAYRAENK